MSTECGCKLGVKISEMEVRFAVFRRRPRLVVGKAGWIRVRLGGALDAPSSNVRLPSGFPHCHLKPGASSRTLLKATLKS
jgi:hypothetical protein